MPNTISAYARQELYSRSSKDVAVTLLTFSHPDFAETFRLCSQGIRIADTPQATYGLVSNGLTFLYIPMGVIHPVMSPGRPPTAKIVMENIGREMIIAIRSVTTHPSCKMELVMQSAPNTIERSYPLLKVMGAQWNAEIVTLELGIKMLEDEMVPSDSFSPSGFPNLF